MSTRTKPRNCKGHCGLCGHWKTNGKDNDAKARTMRKLGQKRRFTKEQDGW